MTKQKGMMMLSEKRVVQFDVLAKGTHTDLVEKPPEVD